MARIAFLSMHDMQGFVADDELAVPPLRELGHEVEVVPWDAEVDWGAYRAAVLRSTWDYHDRLGEFLETLGRIESAGCLLFNPREVVRWNASKAYLRDLEERGVPVVPTLYRTAGEPVDLAAFFAHFQCHDLVLKPTVSASAFDTFRVRNEGGGEGGTRVASSAQEGSGPRPRGERRDPSAGALDRAADRATSGERDGRGATKFGGPVPLLPFTPEAEERIERAFREREYMVQPFLPEVLDPGETSLFFFEGRYSHAILKSPSPGDFRVQEEHGGILTPNDPPRDLVETCGAVVNLFDPPLLYARVDIVRRGELFLLMELELIEPALYFRMAPGSADRFAQALAARIEPGRGTR